MSRESDEFVHDDQYTRMYIDAHLCRPECGDLGTVSSEYKKGIVYLAMFKGPWIVAIFFQSKGYDIITDETCNQCGDQVEIVRVLSEFSKRKCRDCNDYFYIESVSWSTHSFTVVDGELARDRYYYQCPIHYGPQDKGMIFV
jgi:hypothetical protein